MLFFYRFLLSWAVPYFPIDFKIFPMIGNLGTRAWKLTVLIRIHTNLRTLFSWAVNSGFRIRLPPLPIVFSYNNDISFFAGASFKAAKNNNELFDFENTKYIYKYIYIYIYITIYIYIYYNIYIYIIFQNIHFKHVYIYIYI